MSNRVCSIHIDSCGMEVASVALSRPVLVNAPLIESSTKSNKEVVAKNRELCNELLQNIFPLIPPIVCKEKSIDYLKGIHPTCFNTRLASVHRNCSLSCRYPDYQNKIGEGIVLLCSGCC